MTKLFTKKPQAFKERQNINKSDLRFQNFRVDERRIKVFRSLKKNRIAVKFDKRQAKNCGC